MSCLNNKCYLPQPPRAWSRVQNSCSLETTNNNNSFVKIPYSNNIVHGSEIGYYLAMLNKGNVLQYKANSSNITQAQKYSKIAKGKWINRNITWATQSSRGYTNPNTTSLKRIGAVNIAIDPITGQIIGPTSESINCNLISIPEYPVLPSNTGGGANIPPVPPPIVPTPGSDVFPDIIPDNPVEPIIIQDGGTLVCSVVENICTGETIYQPANENVNLTTDSDVPGPIEPLYWNDGNPTWYPRQRYVMTNSENKWPTNAILNSAIKLFPPIITNITNNRDIITINWTHDSQCLPALYFYIFLNEFLVTRVLGVEKETTLLGANCITNKIYMVAQNGDILSEPSNTIDVYIAYIEPPSNLFYSIINSEAIQLIWNIPSINCVPIVSYNIYNGSTFIANTTNLNYIISGLIACQNYDFSVASVDVNGNESIWSTLLNVILLAVNPPINLSYSNVSNGEVLLTWNLPSPNCVPAVSYNIYDEFNNLIANTPNLNYLVTGLINCNIYTYSLKSVDIMGNESEPTYITFQPTWPQPPTNLSLVTKTLTSLTNATTGEATVTISWTDVDNCISIERYNIYIDGVLDGTTSLLTYTTSSLPINNNYNIYITSLATVNTPFGPTQVASVQGSLLSINLPVVYSYNTGSLVNELFTSGSVTLWFLNNNTFVFNYNLMMQFTLVSGGGAGADGFFNDVGTSGGGGGQVLNSDGSGWVVLSDTWAITIGSGQLSPNTATPPSLGTINDSQISGTLNITNTNTVSTTSSMYAGGGGGNTSNYSTHGGGGANNSFTSGLGGYYYKDTSSPSSSSGGGGAGGSQTNINQTGVTSVIVGHGGGNATIATGGIGGNGQIGIDGNIYGGGGGGGSGSPPVSSPSSGGNGGGGQGGSTNTTAQSGTSNTGGGGGGGVYGNSSSNAGNGASGIVVLKFTTP